jgi:uncharacterized paraquat-inducible protein A
MDHAREPHDTDALRAHLSRHVESCPVCGYSLRQLTSDHCPECGARLELRISSSDLRLGPWIAALIGVLLPLGAGLMLLTPFLSILFDDFSSLYFRDRYEFIARFVVLILLLVVYVAVLVRLVRRRHEFWRRQRRTQIRRAVVVLVIGLTSLPATQALTGLLVRGVLD